MNPGGMVPARFVSFATPIWLAMIGVLFAPSGRAAEDEVSAPASATRIGITLTVGFAYLERSPSSLEPGHLNEIEAETLGLELRIHPSRSDGLPSRHGVLLGATFAAALFGPGVALLDLDYSLRLLGGGPLSGSTGAVYVAIGPFYADVANVSPDPDHSVVGGRISMVADYQLSNFTIGIGLDYRGGIPLAGARSPWEQAVSVVLRLGAVFDVGRSLDSPDPGVNAREH